jgi:hypothetical protein
MFEIIRNILTIPIWTITATVFLWFVIYRLFIFFKLSEVNWKRLEYIWIFIGLFGLLSVVEKNNKEFKTVDNFYVKKNIEFNLSRIKFFLSDLQTCFKYNKISSSLLDFDDRQYDQDLICSWSKTYKIDFDTIDGIPTKFLDTLAIKKLIFKTSFMAGYIKEFQSCCSAINSDIKKFNLYKKQIKSNDWENFSRTTGVLFIIIAFAIRLSITTKNVKTTKKNST